MKNENMVFQIYVNAKKAFVPHQALRECKSVPDAKES